MIIHIRIYIGSRKSDNALCANPGEIDNHKNPIQTINYILPPLWKQNKLNHICKREPEILKFCGCIFIKL